MVLALVLSQPPRAEATRRAILADLGGPIAPGIALAGTPDGLYVAHAADLRLYSVADPDHPRLDDTSPPIRLPAPAARLAAAGAWLVAADEAGGLTAIDVADPRAPRMLGTLSLATGPPRDMLIHDDWLLIVDAGGALQTVRMTREQPPQLISRLETSKGGLHQLAVDGSRIYATAVTGRSVVYGPETLWLVTIDWRDPRAPRELGATALDSASGYDGLWPSGIGVARGKVIVLQNEFLWAPAPFPSSRDGVYLLVDPADPQRATVDVAVDRDAEGKVLPPTGLEKVVRVPSLPGLIIRSVDRSLQSVDISEPMHPIFGAAVDVLEEPLLDFTLAGSRIYALDVFGSLVAVDFTEPLRLRAAPAAATAPLAAAVALAGGHAYVSYDRAGLAVFDLADPARPSQKAWLALPDSRPLDLALAGNTAIIAEGEAGLRLLDVSNPTDPRPLALLDTPGHAMRLAALGGLLAIADGPGGLLLVDIAEPIRPTLLNTVDLGTPVTDVALAGDRAFVATEGGGLIVVNVSDPRKAWVVPDTPPIQANRLAVADGRLYVSGYHLVVLSLDELQVLGQYPPKDEDWSQFYGAAGMVVRAGFVYVVGQEFGLDLLDARDPHKIEIVARSGLPGIPRDVALADDFVYSADWHWGLWVSRATVGAQVHGIYLPAVLCPNPTDAFHPIVSAEWSQRLTGEVQPALSGDGRRLVAVADNSLASRPSLRIIDVQSGDLDYITLPTAITAVESPTFVADGRSLLFAGRQERWDIYRISLEDRRLENLTGGYFGPQSQQRRPSMAADGRHLAFDRLDGAASDGLAQAEDIFSLDLGSGAMLRLTKHPAVDKFPSFSPDGGRLLFRSERDGQSELYSMAADGTDLERLTDNPAFDGYPSYSPNGRWIVFQSARSGSDQIYLLDPKTRLVLPLTALDSPAREPRFAPGSDWVVFCMPDGFYDYGTGHTYAQVTAVDLPPGLR